MYSTVSIGSPYKESPTEFSQAAPSNNLSTYFTVELLPTVAPPILSSLEPSKFPPNIHKISLGPEKPPHTLFSRF